MRLYDAMREAEMRQRIAAFAARYSHNLRRNSGRKSAIIQESRSCLFRKANTGTIVTAPSRNGRGLDNHTVCKEP